jgi:biotin operon repressor
MSNRSIERPRQQRSAMYRINARAVLWASQQNLFRHLKYLLKELATWADADGTAFASQAQLAESTGYSEISIRRHLAELERRGLIARTRRYIRGRRGRRSDAITLLMPALSPSKPRQKRPATVPQHKAPLATKPKAGKPIYRSSATVNIYRSSVIGTDREYIYRGHSQAPADLPQPSHERTAPCIRLSPTRDESDHWDISLSPHRQDRCAAIISHPFLAEGRPIMQDADIGHVPSVREAAR